MPKTAKQLADEQKERDAKHHTDRLVWLSGPNPCYADGTPVSNLDILNFTTASKECLADLTGMREYNTGPTE